MTIGESFESLLGHARNGCDQSLGNLCEQYRDRLRKSPRQVPVPLQSKTDQSDLIQQTFLLAFHHFESFQGTTEAEWLAWLMKILERSQLNFIRSYRQVQRRRQQLERSIDAGAADSQITHLQSEDKTPSAIAIRTEQFVHLEAALQSLPEDYRVAIELRHKEQLSFGEIGAQMGRSAEATRKLWSRGIRMLSQSLDSQHALDL